MKILNAEQIRSWDQFSIAKERITSVDLMERAARRCSDWILQHISTSHFHIFCGKGNNGGDGLAIARMLFVAEKNVSVHILEFGHKGTDDFQKNLAHLHLHSKIDISFIQSPENFHPLKRGDVIIDAIFGSGLNRPLESVSAELVKHLNEAGTKIISIDIPSGITTDGSSKNHPHINADHTLSFQSYKLAFLLAENANAIGTIHMLDIGLNDDYLKEISTRFQMTDKPLIRSIYQPRSPYSHKGDHGHALIIAGSFGKIGAALLASRACLRAGVGLLTCHLPGCGYAILQSMAPEAMVLTDFNSSFITRVEADFEKYEAIGIGPGIGTATETRDMLKTVLENTKQSIVIDADALNIIATDKTLITLIPKNSILTPHPKEFDRLFGASDDEMQRIEMAIIKAKELQTCIILKGHHTLIATPGGSGYFNSTGNAGMATAGSGDTLTGILTALLAQGYSSENASVLGVYLHGLAGDQAAANSSMEAMVASDITDNLGKAFSLINSFT